MLHLGISIKNVEHGLIYKKVILKNLQKCMQKFTLRKLQKFGWARPVGGAIKIINVIKQRLLQYLSLRTHANSHPVWTKEDTVKHINACSFIIYNWCNYCACVGLNIYRTNSSFKSLQVTGICFDPNNSCLYRYTVAYRNCDNLHTGKH